MAKEHIKDKTSIKIFETACTWILGASLLVGVLLSLKILDVFSKLHSNTNSNYDYVDIMLELIKKDKDLKHIETLAKIHRTFLVIAIIILSMYILFRILKKEQKKLLKFNALSFIFAIIFSLYLVYLSNDIFYAIKSINTRLYTTDFSKTIYLMQKLQNIKDLRFVIAIVFLASLSLMALAFIANLYEASQRQDKLVYKKINLTLSTTILSLFLILLVVNFEIKSKANLIIPKHYFILAYDLDNENNIVPVAYVNHKEIEKKYIDPYKRNFLEYGMVFDIAEKDKKFSENKNIKIITSYDVEKANEIGLNIKDLEFYAKNKKTPKLLKDGEEFSKKSLIDLLKKYDTRFIEKSKADEEFNLYKTIDRNGNLEFYLIQLVDVRFVSSKIKKNFRSDRKYVNQIMYIGNIFIDEDKKVLSYTGMNNKSVFAYETDDDRLNLFISEMKLVKYVGKE